MKMRGSSELSDAGYRTKGSFFGPARDVAFGILPSYAQQILPLVPGTSLQPMPAGPDPTCQYCSADVVQCTVETNGVLRRFVVNTDLSNVVYGEHCGMFNAFRSRCKTIQTRAPLARRPRGIMLPWQ